MTTIPRGRAPRGTGLAGLPVGEVVLAGDALPLSEMALIAGEALACEPDSGPAAQPDSKSPVNAAAHFMPVGTPNRCRGYGQGTPSRRPSVSDVAKGTSRKVAGMRPL